MAKVSRKAILQEFRTRSLLEATRKVIAAGGFDAVTMERVAEEAGITKGGIYLYFRNKDEMILAAIGEIAEQVVGEIERQVEPKAAPWARLCQLVRAQLDIMERHRDLLRTLLLDRRLLRDSPRGKHSRLILKHRRGHESFIQAILEDGVRRRAFSPMETSRAAFYINEMMISTAQKRMLGLAGASPKEEADGLIRFLSLLLCGKKNKAQVAEEKL